MPVGTPSTCCFTQELVIGKRRGLMRLCLAEGAQVHAAFFFGTSDLLTVVQDPWGLMETLSRKMRAGVMGFYGRWFLPIPRRVAPDEIALGGDAFDVNGHRWIPDSEWWFSFEDLSVSECP